MEYTIKLTKIKDIALYKKISNLRCDEWLKVIELGLLAYENTNDQKHRWDNDDFSKRLKKVEKEYLTKIQDLQNNFQKQLKEKNDLLTEKSQFFEKKKLDLYNDIKNTTEMQYKTNIDFKNKQLETLQKEIKTLKQKEQKQYLSWVEEERKRQNQANCQHKKELEQLREKYEDKLDNLNKIVQSIQMIQENSSLKGQIGESKVFNTLTMLFPKNEIEDTHSTPNRGDFIIHLNNDKKILIDNKDYKNNVPKKEIDKFYQDIETNVDVHGGILMSNTSGIAKKEDFGIEIVAGKPVIYLYHTNNNDSKIKSAVDMISSIIQSEGIDFSNVEIAKKIKDYASNLKKKIAKIRRDLKKHEEIMMSTILDIENTVKKIFFTTNTKF